MSWFKKLFGKRDGADIITNSIGMKLKLIQPGTFMMGSNEDVYPDSVHQVTISKPFYLGVYQVTQREWQAVMGDNPSCFKDAKNPVESVSWDDAQEFCRKLSQKEGVEYRLPTEAEWEYACRAGTKTRYYWGGEFNDAYAWWDGNSGGQTHNVGTRKPNAWGLYDMSGNVLEWCEDWFEPYPSGPQTDPKGPSNGEYRVLRGGSWTAAGFLAGQVALGSAYRARVDPRVREYDFGFRVARTPLFPG